MTVEYDYELTRFNRQSKNTFRPIFDKSFSNVAILKGPNSSGKSTLMNMIAFAFYGEDNPGVLDELQNKLINLHNSQKSDLKFRLTLKAGDRILKAEIDKTGFINGEPEFNRKLIESLDGVNFNQINKEYFKNNYRLVYDIPEKPLDRINDLVKYAYQEACETRDNLNHLRKTLGDTINEVHNSRNDDLIKRCKKLVDKYGSDVDSFNYNLKEIQSKENKLKGYYYSKITSDALAELDKLNNELKDIKKDNKKEEKESKRDKKKYDAKLSEIKLIIKKIQHKYRLLELHKSYISKVEGSVNYYIDFYKNHKLEDEIKNKGENLNYYNSSTGDLLQEISSAYKSNSNSKKLSEKKILEQFLDILEPYQNRGNTDVSLLNQDLDEFYSKLKNQLKEVSVEIQDYERIKGITEDLNFIKDKFRNLQTMIRDLGDEPAPPEHDEEYIEILNKKIHEMNLKVDELLNIANKNGISADNFSDKIDEALEDPKVSALIGESDEETKVNLKNLEEEITINKGNLNKTNLLLSNEKKTLKKLESKEKHPLASCAFKLKELSHKITNLLRSLDNKTNILDKARFNNYDDVTEGDEEFLNSIWSYLGDRLGKVRHIGEYYKVSSINMIDKVIVAGDKEIDFEEMGTGESQLAYMSGVLKSDDSRRLIVLFDEIEHMDESTLDLVVNDLRNLHSNNKLMIGLMAMPGGPNSEVVNYDRLQSGIFEKNVQ